MISFRHAKQTCKNVANTTFKVDCYILNAVLLVIILLFIIPIICYHYAKHRSNRKNILAQKMENKEFKKFWIKNCTCYYCNDINKFEDFWFENFWVNEKSHKNSLIYEILHKTLIDANSLHIRFNKIDRYSRVYNGSRYLALFGLQKYVIYNRIRYLLSQESGVTCFLLSITWLVIFMILFL